MIAAMEQRRNNAWYIKNKRKTERKIDMSEIVKKFIGKKCLISTINTGGFDGGDIADVTAVEDNWVVLNTKKGEKIINIDFIVKIEEYGKKKA